MCITPSVAVVVTVVTVLNTCKIIIVAVVTRQNSKFEKNNYLRPIDKNNNEVTVLLGRWKISTVLDGEVRRCFDKNGSRAQLQIFSINPTRLVHFKGFWFWLTGCRQKVRQGFLCCRMSIQAPNYRTFGTRCKV